MSDYPPHLQNLLSTAMFEEHNVVLTEQALENAQEMAKKARLNFLEAKARDIGFEKGSIFYLTEYNYSWQKINGKPEWVKDAGSEVPCIVREIRDSGRIEEHDDVYHKPETTPTIEYSRRLKSGRWSLRTSWLWCMPIDELKTHVRLP